MPSFDTRQSTWALTNDELWSKITPPTRTGEYIDATHLSLLGSDQPDRGDFEASDESEPAPDQDKTSSIGHPGFAESFIPIWGSGREAIADYQEGKIGEAALNAALAVSDLFLASSLAKGVWKGAFKLGSHKWNRTREWLGTRGYAKPGQPVHHWLIPQRRWGINVPEVIKNQPWNLKAMPDHAFHRRVHGQGKKAFIPPLRVWHGTPAWVKVGAGSVLGHSNEPYWDSNGEYSN
jgi:hypothetical protein